MIRVALPAAALAAALMLSGCSSAGPGISAATSTALQQEVRAVAGLAAAHRYPAALAAAATLRGDLQAALAAGTVSDQRAGSIRAALALVEQDLHAAQAAAHPAPAPTRTATPTPTPTVTQATSTPTATPTPDAKKTDAAIRKAIDAAKRTVEQQQQRWWHGKGKHKKGGD